MQFSQGRDDDQDRPRLFEAISQDYHSCTHTLSESQYEDVWVIAMWKLILGSTLDWAWQSTTEESISVFVSWIVRSTVGNPQTQTKKCTSYPQTWFRYTTLPTSITKKLPKPAMLHRSLQDCLRRHCSESVMSAVTTPSDRGLEPGGLVKRKIGGTSRCFL